MREIRDPDSFLRPHGATLFVYIHQDSCRPWYSDRDGAEENVGTLESSIEPCIIVDPWKHRAGEEAATRTSSWQTRPGERNLLSLSPFVCLPLLQLALAPWCRTIYGDAVK